MTEKLNSVAGATGPQGPQGATGATGPQGATGATGDPSSLATHGSNANGYWHRLADGTQICRFDTYINPVADTVTFTTWTFPAAFNAAPHVSVTANTSAITVKNCSAINLTSTNCEVGIYRTNTTNTQLFCIAIGTWM